jgi:hypothetical protein
MSPQQKGTNWTIVALAISTGVTIWYTGRATGNIERSVANVERRMDQRDAKDEMQDGRLLGHDISLSAIQTDVSALKEGRYLAPARSTPVFPNKFNGAGVGN